MSRTGEDLERHPSREPSPILHHPAEKWMRDGRRGTHLTQFYAGDNCKNVIQRLLTIQELYSHETLMRELRKNGTKWLKRRGGFTLVELLVVIGVIALL